ncbi:MAG: hypothetical protein R3Y27_05760 [Clostridia bacterium]
MKFLNKINFKYGKIVTTVMMAIFGVRSIYTAFSNVVPLVLTLVCLGLLQILIAGEDFIKGFKRNAYVSMIIAVVVYVFMGYVIYLFV